MPYYAFPSGEKHVTYSNTKCLLLLAEVYNPLSEEEVSSLEVFEKVCVLEDAVRSSFLDTTRTQDLSKDDGGKRLLGVERF